MNFRRFATALTASALLWLSHGTSASLASPGAPQTEKPQADILSELEKAVRSALNQEGWQAEAFQVVFLINPVFTPDHVRLHRLPSGEGVPPASSAGIRGTVTDSAGAVIPGAKVRLVSKDGGGGLMTVFSADRGTFRFGALRPGRYTLETALAGFKNSVLHFELREYQDRELRVTLEFGKMGEAIELNLDPPAVPPSRKGEDTARSGNHLQPGWKQGEAYAVAAACRDADNCWPFWLRLADAQVTAVRAGASYPPSNISFSRQELTRIHQRLDDLYTKAIDIGQGRDRFLSILNLAFVKAVQETHRFEASRRGGENRRSPPSSGWDDLIQASPETVQSALSTLANSLVLRTWNRFEGLSPPDGPQGPEPATGEDFLRRFSEVENEAYGALKKIGALEPDHVRPLQPFLKLYAGQGFIAKHFNGDGPRKLSAHLPDSAVIYRAAFAQMVLYFLDLPDRIQLINLEIAD